MTSILTLTREQAIGLMGWRFLETLAPEMMMYRHLLDAGSKALFEKKACSKCVRRKYSTWERMWLTKLHIAINRDEDLKIVVAQFLAAADPTAFDLFHKIQDALGATQTAGK